MSNRIKSLELMKKLRPFTQLSLLPADKANEIVVAYTNNNNTPLKNFIFSGEIPVTYSPLLAEIQQIFLS